MPTLIIQGIDIYKDLLSILGNLHCLIKFRKYALLRCIPQKDLMGQAVDHKVKNTN
jgi:hypothetical protein